MLGLFSFIFERRNSMDEFKLKWDYKKDGPIMGYKVGERVSYNGRTYEAIAKSYLPMSDSFIPEIKKVIFNDPATIVLWEDGTKTVVKTCEGDLFDPEKGLAMAITKKALGNKGNYYNTLKPWIDAYNEANTYPSISLNFADIGDTFADAFARAFYGWDG